MKTIITEEMRFREKICKYAKKHGVIKATRKYHTNRQFIYRQLEKYNGTVQSLALRSTRAKSHPSEFLLRKNRTFHVFPPFTMVL
ncbi:MAG: hypothetical protein ACK5LT_07080 [Lachnospirales bacterium]